MFVLSLLIGLARGGRAATPPGSLNGELTLGGTGAALGLLQNLGDEFRKSHPDATIRVLPSMGSGGGIKALSAGVLGLSVSSRPLTASELAGGLLALEIGRTPLVFVAGPGVALREISSEQLVSFYAGKKTQWPNGALVRPVLRPLDDVDTLLVKKISPAMAEALQTAHGRPGRNIAITDTDSATVLERVPGALGTSTMSLIRAEGRPLKPLSVDGVSPLLADGVNPAYPYQKSIYIVRPSQPSELAQAFLDFVQSPAAAKVLMQNGTTPLGAAK